MVFARQRISRKWQPGAQERARWINGYQFASGKVTTAGKFAPHYGRFEIRAKLPTGQGIWPAHWLLPYGHWPPEVDITELIGSQPWNLVVSHHRAPLLSGCVYPWNCGMTHNATINWGVDWTANWHTFALEWDWWGIKWFVDGAEVFASYYTPPDEPMFLILNTAIGGNWPGWPDGSTQWPQWHLIDFVRVYQRHWEAALLNGGFESIEDGAFPNWNSDDDGNIVPDTVAANAHSGSGSLKMFGRFNGANNSSWLTQILPAGEAQMWQAAVWAANRPGDLVSGANTARFKLEFVDGFGALLAQHALTVVDSNTPPAYARFVIRQKAPQWTTHARLVLEFNQVSNAPGAANFDDAELFLVTPELSGSARVLVNGGFEQGDGNQVSSWNGYGTATNIVRETNAANLCEGSRATRVLAQTGGTTNKTGLYQDIPARPAEFWTASVGARSAAGAPLLGGNRAVLKLEFVAEDGTILQQNEATVLDAASPTGCTNATLQAYAPVNTAFARLVAEFQQEPGGGGSVCFDNASLSTTTATSALLNAGLELYDGTNFPGWSEYGAGWNVVQDPLTANARSGSGAAQMFGQFNGANNESGLFQDMPAGWGQIWHASVWAQNRPGDGLLGNNFARLKLEFVDANGAVLDRDEVIVARSNSPAWYQPFVIRRTAPEWTAKARLTLAQFQRNEANGSVNFDDAELRPITVGDPRALLNASFEDGDGNAFLNWPTWNANNNIVRESVTNRARSGTQAVKLFGTFQGADNRSGLFQDLPAQEGELWQASVWGRNRPGDALQGDNRVRLKIEFVGTNDTVLLTNRLTILTAASSTNYEPFTIRRRAPAGTGRARMVIEFIQPNFAAGAVILDDAETKILTATDVDRRLLNGGFETGQTTEFAEWIPFGPGNLQNILRDPSTNNARTGRQCLQVFGAFNGQNNSSGLYQDIPVTPGELWQAAIWARNRPGDTLQSSNRALFKLEFVNAQGTVLQGDQLLAVNAASPTNYQWLALRNVAPAGAAFARIVIQLDQFASAGGSASFDDAELRLITAQSQPALLNGGFEYRGSSDFANWTRSDAGFNTLLETNAARALSGATALQMFGRFSGGVNNSDLYQDLPALEGQLWQASVWACNRPGDPLQGANHAKLKLEFLDTNRQVLAASEQVAATAASSTNYQRFSVLRAAPAGTGWARLTLEMVQADNAPGSVLFDDAALDALPDLTGPQAPAITLWDGPLRPNGTVSLNGDLLLGSAASLTMNINGTNICCDYDRIQVTGRAVLAGTLSVELPSSFTTQPFVPRPGQTFTLVSAGAISNTFALIQTPPGLGGGGAFAVDYRSTSVVLRVTAELDRDSDGLPDWWEAAFFNSPVNANAALDADNDGASTLAEFIADTNPTNAASRFRIECLSTNQAGLAIHFTSSSNRVYTLQFANDPAVASWTNIPSQTAIPGTGARQSLIDPAPSTGQRFYRLNVQQP